MQKCFAVKLFGKTFKINIRLQPSLIEANPY
jgi:hypothetical protein